MTQPTGVFVRLHNGELSEDQKRHYQQGKYGEHPNTTGYCGILGGLLAIGTPVTGGELGCEAVLQYLAEARSLRVVSWNAKPFPDKADVQVTPLADALAKLAEKDAEILRFQAKQPLYDRMVQENGELKLAVARLQSPEFYGTEGQDVGSDDIPSLFDFGQDNEVIEINGYRCVSTQFGFFDGTDVHLYSSEDEALSAVKALKGPEA